jgi:hypothetical protein
VTGQPRVEIVVDELVVRGLEPREARAAAAALEGRLSELAGAGADGLASRDEAVRRLPPVAPASTAPAALGEAVAGAVWNGLASGGRP